ncbi:MAG: sodium/glutamate symporter [Pseudomonadota bacterium]
MEFSADPTGVIINLDSFGSVTVGFIVFFLGAFLTRNSRFLRNYNIPEPVSGGFAIALITWLLYSLDIIVSFDLAVRDSLLVIFFASIGLNARFSDLLNGGRLLIILLGLTLTYMVLQNLVALSGTTMFGLPKSVSVLIGSASLIGGHGTAIAWGPTIAAQTGFQAAAEIGAASATLGLIFAAVIGGPIAKLLIEKNSLQSDAQDEQLVGLAHDEAPQTEERDINHVNIMRVLLTLHTGIALGIVFKVGLDAAGLKLPLFVPVMLASILLSNTVPLLLPKLEWPARTRSLAIVSDYSLSVFLAMSLMSMQLWVLADLGLPLIAILLCQVLATSAFVLLIFFKAVGSSYTSAVLSSGFAGFALGATPTAIANMTSVAKRYGPAPLAFIILPLVSAFFVDLANAFIIQFFVAL